MTKNKKTFGQKIISILSDELQKKKKAKIYCPICNKFYNEDKVSKIDRYETRKKPIFNNDPFGHRDKMEWSCDKYLIKEQICPKGHNIQLSSTYIDSTFEEITF